MRLAHLAIKLSMHHLDCILLPRVAPLVDSFLMVLLVRLSRNVIPRVDLLCCSFLGYLRVNFLLCRAGILLQFWHHLPFVQRRVELALADLLSLCVVAS